MINLFGMEFTGLDVNEAIEAEIANCAQIWGDMDEERCETRREMWWSAVEAGKAEGLKQFLMPNHVTVMAVRLPEAVNELKKLAAKAQRYGTPEVKWTVGPVYKMGYRRNERSYKIDMVDLIFESLEAPRVGSYQFVAHVECTEAGKIIDCVPGETVPARYRENGNECEHCRQVRSRRDLYLVRGEDGKIVQVGRTCLRDYMGTDTPASVAARFRFIREVRDWGAEFGRAGVRADLTLDVLAVTAAAIRLWGWVPRSAPESAGVPTVEMISPWFNINGSEADKAIRKALDAEVGDDDYKLAQEVLDWVADESSGSSDYMCNLRVILASGSVEAKRRGYAASAVAAYQRHIGRLEEKRREREKVADSQWVGQKGERLRDLKLKVTSARGFSGYYGDTILYKFVDDAGNILTWFSSGGQGLDVGDEIELDATVKAHGDYKGVRETQLTRGKVK